MSQVMRVTHVAIRPSQGAVDACRPALTPELLAATGARYSRSLDGLETILAKVNPDDMDAAVDRIFKFVDYGHASIADMAPVSLFLDGISMWLAYHVWTLVPTAGGQESSTRYIKIGADSVVSPDKVGIVDDRFKSFIDTAMAAYTSALAFWEEISIQNPTLVRIPAGTPDKAAARIRRNFAFDRARYFLPIAAQTNVMLVMSARGWVQLVQMLYAHTSPEAHQLAEMIRDELSLVTPRLLKHARPVDGLVNGIQKELADAALEAAQDCQALHSTYGEADDTASLEIFSPPGVTEDDYVTDLMFHDNRYGHIGPALRRTAVRFSWNAITMAELRDLNRHRTGSKHCPMVPCGFYAAIEQIPEGTNQQALQSLVEQGRQMTIDARKKTAQGDQSAIYWTLLGAQYSFEHTTTADKFLYEAELRTGTGAHYKYAKHLHDALNLWYHQFPRTRGLILEGSAEPE